MEIKPRNYVKNKNGDIVLSEENKIHIKEAETFVNRKIIEKKIAKGKIRYEGIFSTNDYYLHKEDFINQCIR